MPLADESSGPVGRLLGIPVDGADATTMGLKQDIKNAAGRMALLETGDWSAAGDGRVDLAAEADRLEALTPPAQLSEWHLLNIDSLVKTLSHDPGFCCSNSHRLFTRESTLRTFSRSRLLLIHSPRTMS